MQTLDYDALTEMTGRQQWWFGAAELHGMISALTACGSAQRWQEFLPLKENAIAKRLLPQLIEHCHRQLQDNALPYRLLLPEEVPLGERAEQFVYWCQGFLLAYRWSSPQQQDDAVTEFVGEVEAFSQLDSQLEENEENSRLLTELEEYCRLGVSMIYADNHKDIL